MPIPVRSRRFFGPVALAAATSTTVYTVPDDRTAIVRALTFASTNVAASGVQLRLNGDTSGDIIWIGTVATGSTVDLYDLVILNPGDVLIARSSLIGINVSAFGSLLNGEPE